MMASHTEISNLESTPVLGICPAGMDAELDGFCLHNVIQCRADVQSNPHPKKPPSAGYPWEDFHPRDRKTS